MAMRSKFDQISDRDLRALLKKHDCPLGFHEVRARLMGNIASPGMDMAPLQELHRIWGGELPEFASQDDAEQLIGALMGGLWNALSKHQSKSNPFRLTRVKPAPATHDYLAKLSRHRQEEIEAFVDGLFGDHDELDFPETANTSIVNLGEIRGIFAGAYDLCISPPTSAKQESLDETLRNLRSLAIAAELEMNTVIQANKAARAARLESYAMEKPRTVH